MGLSGPARRLPPRVQWYGGDRDGEMGRVPSLSGMRVRLRDGRRRAFVQLGDCPYLPDELSVFCDTCRFNLFTMEGNPSCEDPLHCAHAAEPLEHVENLRTWQTTSP